MARTYFCDDPIGGCTAVLDKAATISDGPRTIHVVGLCTPVRSREENLTTESTYEKMERGGNRVRLGCLPRSELAR